MSTTQVTREGQDASSRALREALGRELADRIRRKGWTIAEAAAQFEWSPSKVRRACRGQTRWVLGEAITVALATEDDDVPVSDAVWSFLGPADAARRAEMEQ